jgi:hypothetical protein
MIVVSGLVHFNMSPQESIGQYPMRLSCAPSDLPQVEEVLGKGPDDRT